MAIQIKEMDTQTVLNHLWCHNLRVAPFSTTLLAKHLINPEKYGLSSLEFRDALLLDTLYALDVMVTEERKSRVLLDNKAIFERCQTVVVGGET